MGEPLPRKITEWMPEAVVHLAWEGIPDFSRQRCKRNVDDQTGFLRLALELPSVGRIVAAGSCSEYGAALGRSSGSMEVTPDGDFGRAKVSIHRMLRSGCAEARVGLTWLRLFYVYGSGQRLESLIPSVLHQLASGDSPVVEQPEAARDFVFVSDVADAFEQAVRSTSVHDVIDLGSGLLRRVREVVDAVVAGSDLSFQPSGGRSRPPADGLWANLDAARDVLGWRPTTGLAEGIRLTRVGLSSSLA
jgi:nucleoside-diphosphate-sugar epimerase